MSEELLAKVIKELNMLSMDLEDLRLSSLSDNEVTRSSLKLKQRRVESLACLLRQYAWSLVPKKDVQSEF